MRVTGKASVVGMRRMIGSRGVVFSADKAAEVSSTHQFFNFILECFTVFCSVAMVAVIAVVFGHVGVERSGSLSWRWDEVGLQSLIKEVGSGDI